MTATVEELVGVARAHAAAEAADDFETTMATLEADPVYELLPKGVALRGRAAAEAYYEYFFSTVKAMVTGYELLNEWVNDGGVAQEYWIEFRPDGGSRERHRVMAVLTFGDVALSGERIYASDRLLELLFGPTLALATPLP
jgi:hypothetical protein